MATCEKHEITCLRKWTLRQGEAFLDHPAGKTFKNKQGLANAPAQSSVLRDRPHSDSLGLHDLHVLFLSTIISLLYNSQIPKLH